MKFTRSAGGLLFSAVDNTRALGEVGGQLLCETISQNVRASFKRNAHGILTTIWIICNYLQEEGAEKVHHYFLLQIRKRSSNGICSTRLRVISATCRSCGDDFDTSRFCLGQGSGDGPRDSTWLNNFRNARGCSLRICQSRTTAAGNAALTRAPLGTSAPQQSITAVVKDRKSEREC